MLVPTCRNAEELEQKVMALSIADSKVAVTVADPNLPDVPLICCSDGFLTLTGYSRCEVIGQNCRFLNQYDSGMSANMRERLRESVSLCSEFIDILPNVKKSGEPFRNLFHMTSFVLRGRKYLIGVQADVTDADVAAAQSQHVEELQRIAESIYSLSLDAWVLMQSRGHPLKLHLPVAKDARESARSKSPKASNQFIIHGLDRAAKHEFILVKDDADERCTEEHGLQWTAPSPRPRELAPEESAVVLTPIGVNEGISKGKEGDNELAKDAEVQLPSSIDVAERIVAPNSASEGLKSVGSAGHPNGCTECSFFFFSRTGCKNGVDCRFCHEIHPRKGKKKHRVPSSKTSSPEGDRKNLVADYARASLTQDPSADGTYVKEAPSLHTAGSAIPSMSYGSRRDVGKPCSSSNEHFDLAVGEKVHLPVCIDLDVNKNQTLLPTLIYSINPVLPPGLDLDPDSGTIKGVCESAHGHSVYNVVASINCYADTGVFFGLVRVASCSFSLRVVGMNAGS